MRIGRVACGVACLLGSLTLRAAPPPEQAFAELKVYSADGRPWRVPREDWAGARDRVLHDPAWAKWLTQERATVDEWMEHRHDRVAWVCGWYHDFVSPKDASRITWKPAVPGEDVAFLSTPSDPQIAITPKIMGGWVYEFRTRHADMISRAAFIYRLTGETRYAEWAAAQLDFYADHYLEWQPQRPDQGARLYWQTLDEATMGTKYINTVRLLGDFSTAVRRQLWWQKFFEPEAAVLNHGFQSIHNIANWHRCAVAEFALVYNNDALWHEAIDGKFGLRNQVARGITADYLWFEQSFHYNEFVVEALLTLFTEAGLSGRAGDLASEMTIAENLMLSPIYIRFPTGMLPNPADGTGIEYVPHRAFLATTYRVFPTTIGLAEAARDRNWNTLLDPPPPPPPSSALPIVTSQNLSASRMAVLRHGPWQVFLHYGQLTSSHAQSEALNFSAFYNNTDITHDPGTVGYGSPFHKEYYTRGLNHNVPLLDGEGEVPPQPGELLSFATEPAAMAAAQPKYQKGVTARRHLAIEGEKLVDIANVQRTGGGPAALGLALHVQGRVQLPPEFAPATTFSEGKPASFRYWKDVASAVYTDRAVFVVDYPEMRLQVTFAVPRRFTVWHGSTPDVPPARREGFYLETHGTEATFTTTFEPLPGARE